MSAKGSPVTGWHSLAQELDAWHGVGQRATLWWRDDDACRDSEALQRLLGVARDHRVPVAVAAIPAATDATLRDAIARCAEATILQHGYAHANHAPAGERSAELGAHRPLDARLDELARGRDMLSRAFADRFAPVLVPPWNRIAPDMFPALPSIGFAGVSSFGARTVARPVSGLVQINTHVDPIAWRRGRVFIGADAAIERFVAHLRARRTGETDASEPTGFLTHHLALDAGAWAFVAELVARALDHPAAAWIDARRAFERAAS